MVCILLLQVFFDFTSYIKTPKKKTHPDPSERPTLSEIKRSLRERLRKRVSNSSIHSLPKDESSGGDDEDDEGYESDDSETDDGTQAPLRVKKVTSSS